MADSYWTRFNQRRLSRRRLLATSATAGAGLAGLAIVGCGDDDDDDDDEPAADETEAPAGEETAAADDDADDEAEETPAAEDIPTGGTFRSALEGGFDSLDPHATVAFGLAFLPRLYNRFLTQSPATTTEINYDLSTALPEQPDDVTYIYDVREDAVISANPYGVPERPMNVDDIIATFDRLRADPTLNAHNYANVETASYSAVDTSHVQFVSNQVNAFYVLGTGFLHFPPVELIEGGNLKSEAVGASSYALDSFTEGQGIAIVRNPTYYGQPLPYVDRIEANLIADRAARRTAFVSNQIDLYGAENAAEAEDLLDQLDNIFDVRELALDTTSIVLQARAGGLFEDDRVRTAILKGIDRQEYSERLQGEGGGEIDSIVWSIFERNKLPADEVEELQGYNPDEATALLEAAGVSGLTVTLTYPTTTTGDGAPIIVEQLARIGVTVELEPLDFATWLGRYQAGDFEMILAPNIPFDNPFAHLGFHETDGPSENGEFWTGFSDPDVDAAIEAIELELNLEAHPELFQEAQRLIYARGPAFQPIYSRYSHTLFYDYVKNYRQGELPPAMYLTRFDFYLDK
jgi:peptide/nickel transport system substrate-binding protein